MNRTEHVLGQGQAAWCWNQMHGRPVIRVVATVAGAGGKDGCPVVDVRLQERSLSKPYAGLVTWSYGWRVKPVEGEHQPDPTMEERCP